MSAPVDQVRPSPPPRPPRPPRPLTTRGGALREILPGLMLLFVAVCWGSSFSMTKVLLERVSPWDYLFLRFAIAAVVGVVVFFPQIRKADAATWGCGVVLGLLYAAGQIPQTWALTRADASVAGFITALYVVITPFLARWLYKVSIPPIVRLAVLLAIGGVAVLGLRGLTVGLGEGALLLCAVAYAAHVVFLGHWSVGRNAFALSAIQLVVIAIIQGAVALPLGLTLPQHGGDWAVIIYLAVIVGLVGLIGQTWAQARMSASRAAIIMSGEPVFAATFAVVWGGESMTWRLIAGGALVMGGVLLAEMGPGTLTDLRRRLHSS